MSYDLDQFVNVTALQTGTRISFDEPEEYSESDEYEFFPAVFAKHFEYDEINRQADPVYVYELKGEPVAFYDCEMFVGYYI